MTIAEQAFNQRPPNEPSAAGYGDLHERFILLQSWRAERNSNGKAKA